MNHKSNTAKTYQERINRVLVYIEANITKKMSLEELSEVSHFSSFHFHRIFAAMTGESVMSYIKRLRIERAAGALIYTQHSITGIALEYGYDNSSAFSKAFKSMMGVSPSELRKTQAMPDISHPCLKLEIENQERTMKHEIKELPAKEVIFIRKTGSYETSPRNAWMAVRDYAAKQNIDLGQKELFGFAYDNPEITDEEKLRFDACVAGIENPKPDGELGVQTIEGGRYAIFVHKGPYDYLEKTFHRAFKEWLPTSGEHLRDYPAFVKYLPKDMSTWTETIMHHPEDLRSEIYIPLE